VKILWLGSSRRDDAVLGIAIAGGRPVDQLERRARTPPDPDSRPPLRDPFAQDRASRYQRRSASSDHRSARRYGPWRDPDRRFRQATDSSPTPGRDPSEIVHLGTDPIPSPASTRLRFREQNRERPAAWRLPAGGTCRPRFTARLQQPRPRSQCEIGMLTSASKRRRPVWRQVDAGRRSTGGSITRR